MSDTLTIKPATGDWFLVRSEAKGDHYVAEAIIAGTHLDVEYGDVTLDPEVWAIQDELHPTLLVESPEHYTPPEDRNERSDQDIVFYAGGFDG